MNTAQTWVAIILGFIVLISLVNRPRKKNRSRACRTYADQVSESQSDLATDLAGLRQDVAALRDQVSSLQRILEQVE